MIAMGFAILSAFFAALVIYPYAVYPLLVRKLPQKPIRKQPTDKAVSLLFCAFNEAESLPDKLENLRRIKTRHSELEVLVFDDGSTDGSTEILEQAGDVVTLLKGEGRSGKAFGMKKLAEMASGEIFVFTDANVILDEASIENLLPYYGDPNVGGVCGTLKYVSVEDSTTAEVGSLYWRIDERLRTLESITGSVMGADGSLFSIRREHYPSFPDSVLDDLTVSMNVVFSGRRLVKADDVIAFEKSVSERTDELRRKVRIGARSYHTHRQLRPQLRKLEPVNQFKYYSRKFLRWFGGLNLALAGLFALAAMAVYSPVAGAALLLVTACLLLAILLSPSGILAKVGDMVMALFATQWGVFKGMMGVTVSTWAPAKSR